MFFVSNLVLLTNASGQHTFVPWEMIDYWHVVYADSTTCDNSVAPLDDISYTIQLLNKDSEGNPSQHFGYDETGKSTLSISSSACVGKKCFKSEAQKEACQIMGIYTWKVRLFLVIWNC